jgi:hypothetical protein
MGCCVALAWVEFGECVCTIVEGVAERDSHGTSCSREDWLVKAGKKTVQSCWRDLDVLQEVLAETRSCSGYPMLEQRTEETWSQNITAALADHFGRVQPLAAGKAGEAEGRVRVGNRNLHSAILKAM